MLRVILPAIAALVLVTAPALAGHCPKDAEAIDAALSKSSISDADKAEIMSLRDKGMEQHEAGDHGESQKTLAEGMRKLLNSI